MFWILSVLILSAQETISTCVLYIIAFNKNYNPIILSIIFISTTIAQIVIFHRLGIKLKTKKTNNLASNLARVYILKANQFISRNGEKFFLVFLASSLFPPFLTSFIAAWLNLPFRTKFYYILIGDCIWFVTTWAIVIVIRFLTGDQSKLLMNVIVISLFFIIFQRKIANQLISK
jgi:hypothetical protein